MRPFKNLFNKKAAGLSDADLETMDQEAKDLMTMLKGAGSAVTEELKKTIREAETLRKELAAARVVDTPSIKELSGIVKKLESEKEKVDQEVRTHCQTVRQVTAAGRNSGNKIYADSYSTFLSLRMQPCLEKAANANRLYSLRIKQIVQEQIVDVGLKEDMPSPPRWRFRSRKF